MDDAPFTSDFAILDVKKGRANLAKAISGGGKIRVRIDMVIDCQHGHDDGTSIEFSGTVQSVKMFRDVGKPRKRPRRS